MSGPEQPTRGTGLRYVDQQALRAWAEGADDLGVLSRSIAHKHASDVFLRDSVGLRPHLSTIASRLFERDGAVPVSKLTTIPFYSLCKGLFLPLAQMAPDKVRFIFGLQTDGPLDYAAREALLTTFLNKDVGLSLVQKLACILGDAFLGQRGTFQRDSLIRVLMGATLSSRRQLLDQLAIRGDIAHVFADSRSSLKADPPLTAGEVLETLALLPDEKRTAKLELVRSLFLRCGKLEAFFLAKLLLRKAGFGFDYQGPLLARALADAYAADADLVAHAIALTSAFDVARILEQDGAAGLKHIQLQPLVPVRPALASGKVKEQERYPAWVERKYDGIRIMGHKSTGLRGSVLVGAYTRRRGDWLELMPGLDVGLKMLPAREVIIDGEIYGFMSDVHGTRPASVYELYTSMGAEKFGRLQLRYAAFDLLYIDGEDLTDKPLHERRRRLQLLLAPLLQMPLPVPFSLADGQLAESAEDVNRLYQYFRNQGYEGVIVKDLHGPYRLAQRDPAWQKRKPEVTLDVVLTGAIFAVTTKQSAGMFGSYVISVKNKDGLFEDVGDVAGIDKAREMDLSAEIMREGLLTGQRIERAGVSGTRPGVELRPHIVATIRFEGITKDNTTGRLSLRGPKLAYIRADKSPDEADTTMAIEKLWVRQRVT